jgi:sugar phosphate isomerase/epimerase
MLAKLKGLRSIAKFQVHNYFPPPKKPFVINLASLDKEILALSMELVRKAIRWSVELDRPIYSFHSGFLVDLKVKELGTTPKKRKINNQRNTISSFIENINQLAKYAEKHGVSLLIENNVLTPNAFKKFNCNSVLMADADDCLEVMKNTPDNVGLLIDVAHLKVSSNVLKFDKINFLNKCDSWIKGYHLSDNDGTRDSNEVINDSAWFWPFLKKKLGYYSLEVYNVDYKILNQQQIKVYKKINEQ